MAEAQKDALKASLNLPRTRFPMRANLTQREPERLDHWERTGLYAEGLENRAGAETYILHDGPPFTNGDIHLGHVLNKTLKDIVLRYKAMRGYRTPYVTGWDCHGLPIEHAVSKQLKASGGDLSPVEVRDACARFAEKYIGVQRAQFRRLGIATDWGRDYRTMDPAYEAEILRTFAAFVEKGLVYRSKKPVYWSIPCATALAEAEIEYHEHVSPSIWVAFDLPDPGPLGSGDPLAVVIWTTTPWTLPANLAIALHPRLDYVVVTHGGRRYLVAAALADAFAAACGLEGAGRGTVHRGADLEGLVARHPFIDRPSPLVLADYVTTEAGTGCVHTAPGHGLEDYLTGIKYGLEIYSPLDDKGRYVDDGQIPSTLAGLSVLAAGGKCSANDGVLELLRESGALLHLDRLEHQYPHCWRSQTPVVFRAMDQWFVSLEKDGLRERVLGAVGDVTWIPASAEKRIRAAVENRPDWCISRQRAWGVPLPVFFDEEGEPYLDAGVVRALADRVERDGTNLWFDGGAERFLAEAGAEGRLPAGWEGKELRPGGDTLDVWIDSGTSHRAVLQKYPELSWPADLYLEGSDQHRGWFQSSLWTGMIADGAPPYRAILTHGFVVGGDGRKIAKRDGAKSATEHMETLGADIFRLLIASEDYSGDIPFSEKIVKQVAGTYRLFRNTFRFQIGNLADFDRAADAVPLDQLAPLDRWALHRTGELVREVTAAYERFEFHRVYQLCNRFCAVTLSAVYHDILKDRLYTWAARSAGRRSAQTAVDLIFDTFCKLLAPVLVFTADEAFAYAAGDEDTAGRSVHLEDFPAAPEEWFDAAAAGDLDRLLVVRDAVNDRLETLRGEKAIGQPLDAAVTLTAPAGTDLEALLHRYHEHLPELFIVSRVDLAESPGDGDLEVAAARAGGERCPRCWRWVPDLQASGLGEICPRCHEASNDLTTATGAPPRPAHPST